MKYLKLVIVASFILFGINNTNAQQKDKQVESKIAIVDVPKAVKSTLKNYSGYKIEEQASFSKNSKGKKVYRFKIKRKNWDYILLVDKKGKVLGVETGEGK